MSETKEKAGKLKVKIKPKKLVKNDEPIKVDLSKPVEKTEEKVEQQDAIQEPKTETIPDDKPSGDIPKVEVKGGESDKEPAPVVESKEEEPVEEVTEITVDEITDEVEEVKQEVEEAISESQETGVALPENIQKVVDFVNETGGTLEDYVALNKDYSKMSDTELLGEYFKQTKPHLNDEERLFVMEDLYSYNEEEDDPKDIKRKKLALKEQVANAKSHLDGQKSKYYNEVKAGSRLTPEQQKAVDFFNRYNKDTEVTKKNQEVFYKKTDEVFNDEFKGFEYNVGEKKFRLNIGNAEKIKNTQSDINNFVNKFTSKETHQITNAKGYHKSLFTAMNPDLVANHFYQQGKADAIEEQMAKAKNVDMSPNATHSDTVEAGGMRVRAISGDTSSDFKVKIGRNPNKIS